MQICKCADVQINSFVLNVQMIAINSVNSDSDEIIAYPQEYHHHGPACFEKCKQGRLVKGNNQLKKWFFGIQFINDQ